MMTAKLPHIKELTETLTQNAEVEEVTVMNQLEGYILNINEALGQFYQSYYPSADNTIVEESPASVEDDGNAMNPTRGYMELITDTVSQFYNSYFSSAET